MTDKIFATYDFDSGLAAARPATPAAAGGRLYVYSATDTGAISIWSGTAWVVVGSGTPGPAGPIGPPGLDSEDPFEPFFVTGPSGQVGAVGAPGAASTVPGPMGLTLDPDEPAEPMIVVGPAGATGPIGLLGPPGLDADDPVESPPIPGPAGQGFTSQGAWISAGTYNPFDVVTYGGSTWLCYSAVAGSSTTPDRDTGHFILWAAKGSQGSTDFALIPPPFNPLPLELAADLTFDLMLTGLY